MTLRNHLLSTSLSLLIHFCLAAQQNLPTNPTQFPNPTSPRIINTDSPTQIVTAEDAQKAQEALLRTLSQAQADLHSPDEDLRASAAKLLGKYKLSQAGDILLTALDDASVKVRRAAVHSLLESQSLYSQDKVEKLFAKIGDQDVEIRREISAAIPILRSRLFVNRTVFIPQPGGGTRTQTIPYRLPPPLQKAVMGRLQDPDAIVRLNTLKYYLYLNLPIPDGIVERCLKDPDRGVVDIAMEKIRIVPRSPQLYQAIGDIAASEDVGLRRKLVSSIRGLTEPEMVAVQTKLLKDPDPFVRCMSAVALASAGQSLPNGTSQAVVDFLMQADFANSQVMGLLYSLGDFGEPETREIYTKLTGHPLPKIRRYSWQRVLNYDNNWQVTKLWMPVLEDPDENVRTMVEGVVQGNVQPVETVHLEKMVESEYADVRALAGRLLVRHPPDVVSGMMFDLLIDDEIPVRRAIIQTIGGVRTEGWQAIMEKSLSEEDFTIQRVAAYALLNDYPNSKPALEKYVNQNPSNPVAVDIAKQMRLKR
jgi:HEAT repeat protein